MLKIKLIGDNLLIIRPRSIIVVPNLIDFRKNTITNMLNDPTIVFNKLSLGKRSLHAHRNKGYRDFRIYWQYGEQLSQHIYTMHSMEYYKVANEDELLEYLL